MTLPRNMTPTAVELPMDDHSFSHDVNMTVYDYYDVDAQGLNLTDYQANLIHNYTDAGKKCMIDYWKESYPLGSHCSAIWDKWQCWPATPADTTVFAECPPDIRSYGWPINLVVNFSGATSHRTCNASAVWWPNDATNYTECIKIVSGVVEDSYDGDIDDVKREGPQDREIASILRDIYFFGGIISCVLLLITFFIFSYFKSLQCNRISIHKHLVVSFIIRSVLIVVMFEPFVSKREHSYRDIAWLCKALMALVYYSTIANTFWMFVEGLFLHNRVAVSVFNTEAPFRVFYAVGWGLPGVIILAWAICMFIFSNDSCWHDNFHLPYSWIILVPVLTALAINTIFLINIIRILITKLRANNTVETDQIRKAVKATAILFPLLGMTNLLYWMAPQDGQVSIMAYRVTNAVLQSSQGIFVSVIYCFMNAEVRAAILKRWQRHKARRMGDNRGRRRSSRTSSFFLSTTENCNPGAPRHSVHNVSVPHFHAQLNTQL